MYRMQPKNTNPKPGFQPLLNMGFGFSKMAGFPVAGFSEPGFQSLMANPENLFGGTLTRRDVPFPAA